MSEQIETVSVRGLKSGTLARVDEKASAASMSREAWLREQIEALAATPVIKERYAYRVYGQNGKGQVRRLGNYPKETGSTFANFSQEEADALHRAEDFMRRNNPGDRERALAVLHEVFEEVFESAV